ncbi:hypothetical protein B0H15DRAFT_926344 [Mycena belliarum]|uniref:Uncharacterized protein n=1 Tax=Mycena belliarum TaxID=1033014 RepID=A0AAD6XYG6_9AGAR|nr:hypothetical protein B0H15DRAFT_926344 [Mycena belliae]
MHLNGFQCRQIAIAQGPFRPLPALPVLVLQLRISYDHLFNVSPSRPIPSTSVLNCMPRDALKAIPVTLAARLLLVPIPGSSSQVFCPHLASTSALTRSWYRGRRKTVNQYLYTGTARDIELNMGKTTARRLGTAKIPRLWLNPIDTSGFKFNTRSQPTTAIDFNHIRLGAIRASLDQLAQRANTPNNSNSTGDLNCANFKFVARTPKTPSLLASSPRKSGKRPSASAALSKTPNSHFKSRSNSAGPESVPAPQASSPRPHLTVKPGPKPGYSPQIRPIINLYQAPSSSPTFKIQAPLPQARKNELPRTSLVLDCLFLAGRLHPRPRAPITSRSISNKHDDNDETSGGGDD